MKALFRVDSSFDIGAGHIMRCLTLAEKFRENGVTVEFLSREHPGNLIEKIVNSNFVVHTLDLKKNEKENETRLKYSHWLGTSQKCDAFECIEHIKEYYYEWLIVDHYAIDEEWQNYLKPYFNKLFVIDDLSDRSHICDFLLDQTYKKKESLYASLVPKGCKLLLGPKYSLLRSEFAELRTRSLNLKKNPQIKNLMINMGGFDSTNLTTSILHHIGKSRLSREINIDVVMGLNAPFLTAVKRKAKEIPFKVNVLEDVKNMASLMSTSDIAIGASGTTTWERCCLGLPTIQVVTASNQEYLAQSLARNNVIKLVDTIDEINEILENSEEWVEYSSYLAAKVCDGLGSDRVLNNMSDIEISIEGYGHVQLNNYVNLDSNEHNLVLDMRNHTTIRNWMHNRSLISKKEHENFIEKLESSTKDKYFLIKFKDSVIGSINFSKIKRNESLEFGIYSNPFSDKKGLGKLLESVATKYAFEILKVKKINLQVYDDNKRAIKFYLSTGFEPLERKKIKSKNVVTMVKRVHL